jgi:hypothetical protein
MFGNCTLLYTSYVLGWSVDPLFGPFMQCNGGCPVSVYVFRSGTLENSPECRKKKVIFVSKVSEVDFESSDARGGAHHSFHTWRLAAPLSCSINLFIATEDQYRTVGSLSSILL